MTDATEESRENNGKKAVHVKWAGKTIALGTFPLKEAEEKCAKAKELTKCWRSTMREKPSREWVMSELERLGVRSVSGKVNESAIESEMRNHGPDAIKSVDGVSSALGNFMHRGDVRTGDDLSSLEKKGFGNSSLGGSNTQDFMRRDSIGSFGHGMSGMEYNDPTISGMKSSTAHEYVGGGAAAAVEAYRHYQSSKMGDDQNLMRQLQGQRSNMGNVLMKGPQSPDQRRKHFEMLKLHHLNLLNELQETTLMMNVCQQQQLQKEKQILEQQQKKMQIQQARLQMEQQKLQQAVPPIININFGKANAGGQFQQSAIQDRGQMPQSLPRGSSLLPNSLSRRSSMMGDFGALDETIPDPPLRNPSLGLSRQLSGSLGSGANMNGSLAPGGNLNGSLATGTNLSGSLATGANLRDSMGFGPPLRGSMTTMGSGLRDSLGLGACDLDLGRRSSGAFAEGLLGGPFDSNMVMASGQSSVKRGAGVFVETNKRQKQNEIS